MRSRTWARVLLLLCLLPGRPSGAAVPGSGGAVEWMESFEEAVERAALERKPLVVSFTAIWCGWCRKMEARTYPAPEIAFRAERMVWVAVDGGRRPDLAKRFAVSAYPTHLFLRPDGGTIASIRGYQDAPAFAGTIDRLLIDSAREFTLRQRLKDRPELVHLHLDLAELLRDRGARDEALEELEGVSASGRPLDPDLSRRTRLLTARLLHETGKHREAAETIRPLASETVGGENEVEILFVLAEAAWAAGTTDEAASAYRRILAKTAKGWLARRADSRLGHEG